MLPMLLNLAVPAPLRREVWRHCESCDELAAMPPYVFVCETCTSDGAGDAAGGDRDE